MPRGYWESPVALVKCTTKYLLCCFSGISANLGPANLKEVISTLRYLHGPWSDFLLLRKLSLRITVVDTSMQDTKNRPDMEKS